MRRRRRISTAIGGRDSGSLKGITSYVFRNFTQFLLLSGIKLVIIRLSGIPSRITTTLQH
ncbi:hypothetical protein IC575_017153 [Cucumis melo]